MRQLGQCRHGGMPWTVRRMSSPFAETTKIPVARPVGELSTIHDQASPTVLIRNRVVGLHRAWVRYAHASCHVRGVRAPPSKNFPAL